MKDILKYLFFLVLGIILYILLNGNDGFSVGIQPFIYTTPGSTNIHYTTSNAPLDAEYFLDLTGTHVTQLNDEVLIVNQIYNDITQGLQQNNPFVNFIGRQDQNGLIHIPITQEQGGGVIDLPGDGPGGMESKHEFNLDDDF